ncbi:DUF5993 family protein [Chenggangzhangella methanolivorans]|uniref:DUF5993 family protein n=1 Tax=Chenggangzhangella methanolivorans TaxID=1437009 RepID=A0A9E6RAN0_9HYPH|nr:DUF5993 family protein [Chenggangzhangella methanolivorans]QZN99858.1 DUF5993 family protein [Chenggangzhangella methanolivorans]
MMSLPFFGFFAAFCLAWAERRGAALSLGLVSLVVLLLLFRRHATDSLPLSF